MLSVYGPSAEHGLDAAKAELDRLRQERLAGKDALPAAVGQVAVLVGFLGRVAEVELAEEQCQLGSLTREGTTRSTANGPA